MTTKLTGRRSDIGNKVAVLNNGLGRYEDALIAAREAAADPTELGFSTLVLQELVEAPVRTDQLDLAREALDSLTTAADAAGTDWALGIAARSRAQVVIDGSAESHHSRAIEHLRRTTVRMELARAHLIYGEWLRRQARRADAREQLHQADDMLTEMGVHGYAQRARRELLATNAAPRKRSVEASLDLTAQELQVAPLAAGGRTRHHPTRGFSCSS